VDETGKIIREAKVASEPDALLQVLRTGAYHFKRIGLEAGPLSQWLFSALAEADLPVICVETRHMRAVLKAQINKTDRNDASGIAQMMRVGPSGACEDTTQSEAAHAAPPLAFAVESNLEVPLADDAQHQPPPQREPKRRC
jgi:transposase